MPFQAGTSRVPNDRDPVLVADSSNHRHLFRRPWVDDGYGQPIGVNRRPFRVAMHVQVFRVDADDIVFFSEGL